MCRYSSMEFDPALHAELIEISLILGWRQGRTVLARRAIPLAVALFDSQLPMVEYLETVTYLNPAVVAIPLA